MQYQWLVAAVASAIAAVVAAVNVYHTYVQGNKGGMYNMVMKWVAVASVVVASLVALTHSMDMIDMPLF